MLCTMIMDNLDGFPQGVLSFEVASPLLGGRTDSVTTETSELNTPIAKVIGTEFQLATTSGEQAGAAASPFKLTPHQLAQTIGKSYIATNITSMQCLNFNDAYNCLEQSPTPSYLAPPLLCWVCLMSVCMSVIGVYSRIVYTCT